MGGQMDGWKDGQMVERWMDGGVGEWTEGQMDGWMEGRMDGWVDDQL